MPSTSPEGPDLVWAKEELNRFVCEAQPKNQSRSGFVTGRSSPACGRAEAIRQLETVKQILDLLYPDWRSDNDPSQHFEFKREHDAAQKMVARLDAQAVVAEKLSRVDSSPSIAASGMHHLVWEAARSQWNLGNHAEAVDAVGRAVNSLLQKRLGRKDVSEGSLVKQALSDKDPEVGKPRLRFPDVGDDQTQGSMRHGVMQFGSGCFAAIRNPLAHLPDDEIDLDEQQALESLAAFSLLARWIDQATVITAEEPETGDDAVAEKP